MTSVSSPLSSPLEKPFLMSRKGLSPYKVPWQLNPAAFLGAGRVTPLHAQLVLCFFLELKLSRQLETSLALALPPSPGNIHTCLFLTKNLLSGSLSHPWFPKTETTVFLCWLHCVFTDYLYREIVGSPFLYLPGKQAGHLEGPVLWGPVDRKWVVGMVSGRAQMGHEIRPGPYSLPETEPSTLHTKLNSAGSVGLETAWMGRTKQEHWQWQQMHKTWCSI